MVIIVKTDAEFVRWIQPIEAALTTAVGDSKYTDLPVNSSACDCIARIISRFPVNVSSIIDFKYIVLHYFMAAVIVTFFQFSYNVEFSL